MHDSQRYRDNAAECLLAAQEAREPHYRQLHLSMALSWLSLAYHDEALDDLLGMTAGLDQAFGIGKSDLDPAPDTPVRALGPEIRLIARSNPSGKGQIRLVERRAAGVARDREPSGTYDVPRDSSCSSTGIDEPDSCKPFGS